MDGNFDLPPETVTNGQLFLLLQALNTKQSIANGRKEADIAVDRPLAKALSASLAKVLGLRNRGAKPENSGQHARLAFVQAGGIIVELFFITNPVDVKAYDDYKWLAARDVARVLKEFDK